MRPSESNNKIPGNGYWKEKLFSNFLHKKATQKFTKPSALIQKILFGFLNVPKKYSYNETFPIKRETCCLFIEYDFRSKYGKLLAYFLSALDDLTYRPPTETTFSLYFNLAGLSL
jgi:hypothetical protein